MVQIQITVVVRDAGWLSDYDNRVEREVRVEAPIDGMRAIPFDALCAGMAVDALDEYVAKQKQAIAADIAAEHIIDEAHYKLEALEP